MALRGVSLDNPPAAATWREHAVALSLLRGGHGTAAARHLKELTDPTREPPIPDDELVTHLAERLNIPAVERTARWSEALNRARRVLAGAEARQISVITSRDEVYPSLLRHIVDPPVVLWTKG